MKAPRGRTRIHIYAESFSGQRSEWTARYNRNKCLSGKYRRMYLFIRGLMTEGLVRPQMVIYFGR